MSSQIKFAYFKTNPKIRFNQGDILQNIEIILATDYDSESGEYEISNLILSYGIVISQECDLEHDYSCRTTTESNQDKYLPSILVLPAYSPIEFKEGKHRGDYTSIRWSTEQFKQIKKNNNPRFHYLKELLDLQIPELIIDFKHVYTVSSSLLYKKLNQTYLGSISEIFREGLSVRYCNYLGRIGLPEIN